MIDYLAKDQTVIGAYYVGHLDEVNENESPI